MTLEKVSQGFDGTALFKNLSMQVEAGERIAIIGPNGIGKTTLLRTLVGDLPADAGEVKWTDSADVGYFAQDHADDFEDDMTTCSTGWASGRRATSNRCAAPWAACCSPTTTSRSR